MGTGTSTHDNREARGMGIDSGNIWEEKLRRLAGGLNQIRWEGMGKR